MEKITAIKQNRDFVRAYTKGKRIKSPLFCMYYVKNRTGTRRLGITVSKKIGNAVIRNRTRRIIREAYRECQDTLKCGWDIVIVAYFNATDKKKDDILSEILRVAPKEITK